jgi:hypothetical protein
MLEAMREKKELVVDSLREWVERGKEAKVNRIRDPQLSFDLGISYHGGT